jgi:hypothetical protein
MDDLCAPALIYLAFSATQVIVDTYNRLYNTAFFKIILTILITLLLQTLCSTGMGLAAWFIVFIPFIFMSVIVAILLYVFGLNPATGSINMIHQNPPVPVPVPVNHTIILEQHPPPPPYPK